MPFEVVCHILCLVKQGQYRVHVAEAIEAVKASVRMEVVAATIARREPIELFPQIVRHILWQMHQHQCRANVAAATAAVATMWPPVPEIRRCEAMHHQLHQIQQHQYRLHLEEAMKLQAVEGSKLINKKQIQYGWRKDQAKCRFRKKVAAAEAAEAARAMLSLQSA